MDKFREYFEGYDDHYIIIGGTATSFQIESRGVDFRVTKDIDIILIIEALNKPFVERFWQFIEAGDYSSRQVEEIERKYYRFDKPRDEEFPAQVELFSKKPDVIEEKEDMHLTPIPTDEDLDSLSAILLNETYYDFTLKHSNTAGGLHMANTEALICLKCRAFLDMTERKEKGGDVSGRNINKHKNDVLRLVSIAPGDLNADTPEEIKACILEFIGMLEKERPDTSVANNVPLEDIIEAMRKMFGVGEIEENN